MPDDIFDQAANNQKQQAPKGDVFDQAAQPARRPSLLARAEKWWTTPTQTEIPGNIPGVEQSPEGMTNSPQQTFRRGAAVSTGVAAPAVVGGLATAPVA